MTPRPIGTTTIAVLQSVADGVQFGFDIIDHTGLPSGTVYPALASLERRGFVKSRWEADGVARSEGRPRRRYYRITKEGEATLSAALERLGRMGLPAPSPALPPDPTPGPAEG